MACIGPDCSYIHNDSVLPPALQANPDVSGIGVLVGFVGTAYITFLMLLLRYIMGLPKETSLDDQSSTNPVDRQFLSFVWRKLRKPPERWGPALARTVLVLSDTQIVTGLAILASGYSQINCGLSIFHWHIVVFLAWFSSATHLTTLTFLRRYIYDNRGIRTLRLVLMLFLVVMLALALIPTGGACGIQNAEQSYTTYGTSDEGASLYPGAPAKCCFELAFSSHFIGSDLTYFLSMIASELVLISGSLARVIKVFRSSSAFAKEWLRHKPARISKLTVRKLEERHGQSKASLMRPVFFVFHCTVIIFIILARATYDIAESILWEISWLSFSLAWGTMRILNVRGLADSDSAATDDSQGQVVLQENFWGFGQWTPTLLLILPLLGLAEGYLDGSDESADTASTTSNQTNDLAATKDNTRITTLGDAGSSLSSSTEQPSCDPPSYIDPYSELDRTTNIPMTRRTGTDLVNMEQQLGAGAEASSGTVTTGQDVSSEVDSRTPETPSPLRSSKRPWPAQTFYDHDFYADGWYKDMLICMFLMALEFGIELISFTAGVGSNTIFTFAENFTSWEIYISVLLLFLYATMCISIERRPERLKWALWFFQRYNQRYKLQLFPLLRRLMLLGILVLNLSIGVSNYMGFSLSSAVLLIVFISSLHKRPAES